MRCVIHMLGAGPRPYPEAAYVLNGFSVCDQDRCLNAVGATHHETVMSARGIDWEDQPEKTADARAVEPVWSATLAHDETYEYTASADCDGSNPYWKRRLPALSAPAGRWEASTRAAHDEAARQTWGGQ